MQANTKEPPTKIKMDEIDRDLRDYARISADIQRINEQLQEIHGGASLTARWTDMPQNKGGVRGSGVEREVIRRDRKQRQLRRMQERVERIDAAAPHITGTRTMILLDHILDGASVQEICHSLRLSRSAVWELRQELVFEITKIINQNKGG